MRTAGVTLTAALLAGALVAGACARRSAPVGQLSVETTELTLAWPQYRSFDVDLVPSSPLPESSEKAWLFLHLLDEPGSVQRTFDQPLPAGWRPGEPIHYSARLYQSALSEPLAPGTYLLSTGIFVPGRGRFPLESSGKEVSRAEYQVAAVRVPPVEKNGPQARFSDNWMPPEAGSDRQILVRRSLRAGSPGKVQFGPLQGPGSILLGVVLPAPQAGGARVELADGASQPRFRVSSSCGGEQAEVSGSGRFDIELRVASAEAPVVCELTLEPNFRVISSDTPEATSVVIELLAWKPGPVDVPTD
jgi:hypothetical protein